MAGTTLQIEYRPAPALARIAAALDAAGRRKAEMEGAQEASRAVQKWLLALSATRHATARALGATPTEIIGRTRNGVKPDERNGAAVVVIPHKLFRRAFQDVAIAPDKQEALAIPALKAAYGKSPRSFGKDYFFIWRRKKGTDGPKDKGAAYLARSEGKRPRKLVIYYHLYRGTITQKKDETLLPPREEIAQAACRGIGRFLKRILKSGGNGAPP